MVAQHARGSIKDGLHPADGADLSGTRLVNTRHTIVYDLEMGRKYLGGSGDRLTVWISIAASTVLIFYGYDQVCAAGDFYDDKRASILTTFFPGRFWKCACQRRFSSHNGIS